LAISACTAAKFQPARDRSHVTEFVSCHVIELEDCGIVFAAIDARVSEQVPQDIGLGGCDCLLFACSALRVLLGGSPVVRLIVFAAAVATVCAGRTRGDPDRSAGSV
jgi:hypothetical protein